MRREGRADLNMGRKSPDLTFLLKKMRDPCPPYGCVLPHSCQVSSFLFPLRFSWGRGKDFSSMVLGPTALVLLLEVNEESPDFLGVHSDDGVSW